MTRRSSASVNPGCASSKRRCSRKMRKRTRARACRARIVTVRRRAMVFCASISRDGAPRAVRHEHRRARHRRALPFEPGHRGAEAALSAAHGRIKRRHAHGCGVGGASASRNRRFESVPLQRRVYKLSVPGRVGQPTTGRATRAMASRRSRDRASLQHCKGGH